MVYIYIIVFAIIKQAYFVLSIKSAESVGYYADVCQYIIIFNSFI